MLPFRLNPRHGDSLDWSKIGRKGSYHAEVSVPAPGLAVIADVGVGSTLDSGPIGYLSVSVKQTNEFFEKKKAIDRAMEAAGVGDTYEAGRYPPGPVSPQRPPQKVQVYRFPIYFGVDAEDAKQEIAKRYAAVVAALRSV